MVSLPADEVEGRKRAGRQSPHVGRQSPDVICSASLPVGTVGFVL